MQLNNNQADNMYFIIINLTLFFYTLFKIYYLSMISNNTCLIIIQLYIFIISNFFSIKSYKI